ncbi:Rpn family recombination-promoting nuclease/putative transposase [Fodinicurvata sp. EGI_FJ10296]|uniref:Rpn family recombination-promoting nuclease/putative transposase n=1 Tax=Fodinicurvata sp. EGI_FJ10296 TaxID=3231908 RepID=UPI0034553646
MSDISNPHDALFRAILDDAGRAAALIRDYLPPELAELLADSPPDPVDGSYIDAKLRSTQSDRLFRTATRSGSTAFIYVLLEHKSHPDANTPLQIAEYMLRIWRRHRSNEGGGRLPPILPLVLYHGVADWTVPTSLAGCIEAEGPLLKAASGFGYTLQDLKRRDYETLSADHAVRSGLAALRYVFDRAVSVEILHRIVQDAPDEAVFTLQIFEYIGNTYDVPADTLIDVIRRVKPHREAEFMATPAQQWRDEGRVEGRVEGRDEGIALGASDALIRSVLRTLDLRFGSVPPSIATRVRATPANDLDALLERAVTAPSLSAVFDDGPTH